MNNIDLTIIIPFYRGEEFIERLISSIENSFLRIQNNKEFIFEIIIIIDSPESNAEEISIRVNGYRFAGTRLRVLKNETNLGVAATRNKGLRESRGEYLYFIDQDDEIAPDFFERIARAFKVGFEFILLNGTIEYINKNLNGHYIYYLTPRLDLKNLILDDLIRSPGQVLIRKNILKGLEFPVPNKNFGSDDKFFWILIFLHNSNLKTLYIKQPLYKAYIHETNYSNDRLELRWSSLEAWSLLTSSHDTSIIKKYINRNINYLRFTLRSEIHLSLKDKIFGLYETMRYFLRINKIIRYGIKHM